MSEQQLICMAEDRHRAVLLAGCLMDLGYPVVQLNAPPAVIREPALVLWTRRAAQARWVRELFVQHPQSIALVIDEIPAPAGARRVVALQNWPARSADASISALVSWLQHPTAAVSPFISQQKLSPQPDPGMGVVLGFLAAAVTVLLLLISGTGEEEPAPPADYPPAAAVPGSQQSLPAAAIESRQSTDPGKAFDSGASPAARASLISSAGSRAAAPTQPESAPTPRSTESRPAAASVIAGVGHEDDYRSGNDSLSHLCRAQSLAAALAWYGVLTAEQRRRAPELACIRRLLSLPGYEALREKIQA